MNYILLFIATASILTVHDRLHSVQIEYSCVLSYPIHDTGGHAAHRSGVRYTKCVTVRPGNVGCQTQEPRAAQNIACAGRLQVESHSGAAGNMRHQKQQYCVPLAWASSSRVGNARRRRQEQCIASNMSNKAEVRIITNVPAFLRRNFAHNEWGGQDLEYLLHWGKESINRPVEIFGFPTTRESIT
ncbi:hypothetical protein EDD15DRAFT_2271837 [Pisolithus albus]|nr:hypothetical protein EDD15DRAFT_2271837 [Pisolithus albus]